MTSESSKESSSLSFEMQESTDAVEVNLESPASKARRQRIQVNQPYTHYSKHDDSSSESRNDSELSNHLTLPQLHNALADPDLEILASRSVEEEVAHDTVVKTAKATAASLLAARLRSSKQNLHSENNLSARAEEIIREAKLACSASSATLDDKSPRGTATLHTSKSLSSMSGLETSQPSRDKQVVLRTTKEVLQLANAVLPHNSPKNRRGLASDPAVQNGLSPRSAYISPRASTSMDDARQIERCWSPTESSIASLDDYERSFAGLPMRLSSAPMSREGVLDRIDGIIQPKAGFKVPEIDADDNHINVTRQRRRPTQEDESSFANPLDSILRYFWGTTSENNQDHDSAAMMGTLHVGSLDLDDVPDMSSTSIVRVKSEPPPPTTIAHHSDSVAVQVDPRMPEWIDTQLHKPPELPKDGGSYHLGKSRTVIVHEIVRGHWTWCTAWSPDGNLLAVATENHHLAVIDTMGSTVWRVKHDERIHYPPRKHTTHSIRAIAWGQSFIAIGGTGDSVSILASIEPYPILHTIRETGFVGSLSWKPNSSVLAIGSRLDRCLIVRVAATDGDGEGMPPGSGRHIQSTLLHTIKTEDWVNAISFNPSGKLLAIGDRSGLLSVYQFQEEIKQPVTVQLLKTFSADDCILTLEWSPDGRFLYCGGEDFSLSVIDCIRWKLVQRVDRDNWVQFVASSQSGSHIAVGGVKSEVSILDPNQNFETVLSVQLKGLVPLSAKWHPKDQYLALTGQNTSILVVETTNARHVAGHFLRSISPVLAIEFSPDGRMAAIGNQGGIVTFYTLSETTFITSYEMVLAQGGNLCIRWSKNGKFAVVGNGNSIVVVGRMKPRGPTSTQPPNAVGFSVRKVIRNLGEVHSVCIDCSSRYIIVSGEYTRVFDTKSDFECVRVWSSVAGTVLASSWSPDSSWIASVGKDEQLSIYDTRQEDPKRWRVTFRVEAEKAGMALAWGPTVAHGLMYVAFGGEDRKVTIVEIRTQEESWETVLQIPRDGPIHDLDWNSDGLLAAAIGNGTVSIIDLAYLQSGWAVNEMDYNWQRQALTCFTEIRRSRGVNSMRTCRWIPSAPGSDSLLAVGGTDGALEIIDLTERQRCRGFVRDPDDP